MFPVWRVRKDATVSGALPETTERIILRVRVWTMRCDVTTSKPRPSPRPQPMSTSRAWRHLHLVFSPVPSIIPHTHSRYTPRENFHSASRHREPLTQLHAQISKCLFNRLLRWVESCLLVSPRSGWRVTSPAQTPTPHRTTKQWVKGSVTSRRFFSSFTPHPLRQMNMWNMNFVEMIWSYWFASLIIWLICSNNMNYGFFLPVTPRGPQLLDLNSIRLLSFLLRKSL